MEQNDLQRLKNLVSAIEHNTTWELDNEFRGKLNNFIDYGLITMYRSTLYYHSYAVREYIDWEDRMSWKNRKVSNDFSVSNLHRFGDKILTTILRNKLTTLTDDVLILCAAVHHSLEGNIKVTIRDNERTHNKYYGDDYAYNINEIKVLLPKEILKRFPMPESKPKVDNGEKSNE